MKRALIVAGAPIEDYDALKVLLRADDYSIFCDSGLRHAMGLNVEPQLVLGDFDSHPRPEMDCEIIQLPCQKDDTDSMYAVKLALERGFEDFLLLGMTGARLDHTLGNLSMLVYLNSRGKKAVMADDYALMEMVSQGKPAVIEPGYKYFSVINLTGTARGISIENARYPLEKARIDWEYQYGISNETFPGEEARVSVEQGEVLLMKVRKG